MEEKKTYKKGEAAPETALYECTTCKEIKKSVKYRVKEGEKFPGCKACSDAGETKWEKADSDLDMPADVPS